MTFKYYSTYFHEVAKTPSPVMFKQFDRTTYRFYNFFHPYVGDFIKRLNQGELSEFMRSDIDIADDDFFPNEYSIPEEYKDDDSKIKIEYFPKSVEFGVKSPYGIYNWEIFYHIPIAVATHLSKNQRFADAQKWFHYVFNPLTDEQEDSQNPTARYWNFKYFRDHASQTKLITELMEDLAGEEENEEIDDIIHSIAQWQATPFDPHTVAKFRPLSYQFNVVMKYIDNLIAWGDSLFRQFTIETLNEATQLYILASNILGNKPQEVPILKKSVPKTYNDIKDRLDEFSNVLVQMENEFPLNSNYPSSNGGGNQVSYSDSSRQLYFCIPENSKLLGYWDLVKDRLFKIRHCMDIEGNVRQIPLFQPTIDPGMLVKAAASGMSVGDIVSGLNQPSSHVRFPVLAQKASELISEVKAMGQTLLSVIEKKDAESLMLLRQTQELKILGLVQDIKFMQWQESKAAITSLLKSRETVYQRYKHYQQLLGNEADEIEAPSIEYRKITEENFDEVYAELVEKYQQPIDPEEYREEKFGLIGDVISDIADSIGVDDSELSTNLALNKGESMELNVYGPLTTGFEVLSYGMSFLSAPALSLIPQFDAVGTPMGVGVKTSYGGNNLEKAAGHLSGAFSKAAEISTKMGAQSLKLASYQRRVDEWVLQSNQTAKELEHIGTQIISSLIREQITKKEYENHKVQIENSQEIDKFLKEQKFANEELYLWMQGEISKNYFDFYKLAFDTAKKAEATMKQELMREELDSRDFIQFNYWDAGRKGLLSGEKLALDMKKMELAYIEHNKRELELTKHISLMRLNPEALLSLKVNGTCQVSIPEWLFDMDYPGHYMRRIKSVSISIPAITGPFNGIPCTLSLENSTLRVSSLLNNDEYVRENTNDDRFKDYFGTVESIATSSAQNDSGMFETNLRDERFLPFEGAGVESTWNLTLPSDFRQFDYDSISDVIIHMNYTARDGGKLLGDGAIESLTTKMAENNFVRMYHLKHDFSSEWHRFINSTDDPLTVTIKKEHFPYFTQNRTLSVQSFKLIALPDLSQINIDVNLDDVNDDLGSEVQSSELVLSDDTVLERDSNLNVVLIVNYKLEE